MQGRSANLALHAPALQPRKAAGFYGISTLLSTASRRSLLIKNLVSLTRETPIQKNLSEKKRADLKHVTRAGHPTRVGGYM